MYECRQAPRLREFADKREGIGKLENLWTQTYLDAWEGAEVPERRITFFNVQEKEQRAQFEALAIAATR